MTIMNEVNPPLDDVLEHHGVKGMRWGTRKSGPARQARKDFKRHIVLKNSGNHRGAVSERKLHAEMVARRSAKSPTYKKEFARRKKRNDFFNSPTFLIGATVGFLAVSALARQDSTYSAVNRGRSYVDSKPPMMNAKLKNGVYQF